MTSLPESVVQLWRDLSVEIRPAARSEKFLSFERQNGMAIPEELAAFYRVSDGVESDQNLFAVWELAAVRRAPVAVGDFRGIPDYGQIATALPNADEYLVFADFMIMSHVFAVHVDPTSRLMGQVIWISGSDHGVAATSFRAFWEAYLADQWDAVSI